MMRISKEKRVRLLAGMGLLLIAFIWGFAFVVVKNFEVESAACASRCGAGCVSFYGIFASDDRL